MLLILLFVWLTVSSYVYQLIKGQETPSWWKGALADVITAPNQWADFVATRHLRGTVGSWLVSLAAWLTSR